MPGSNKASKNERRGDAKQKSAGELRADYLKFARVSVCRAPRNRRKQQEWDRLNTAHKSELQRRISKLVDEPTARDLIHPRAERCEDLPIPEQPIVAEAQRLEGAQANDQCKRVPKSIIRFSLDTIFLRRANRFLLYRGM